MTDAAMLGGSVVTGQAPAGRFDLAVSAALPPVRADENVNPVAARRR